MAKCFFPIIRKLKNNKGFAYLFDYEDEAYGKHIAEISKKIVEDCEFEVIGQELHTDKN